jgi:pimeloyl-ACP methyl ester carboxylesterase
MDGANMYLGEERLIKIPGFTFAAREWGDKNALPVLALHGWLDNASSFEFLAPLLLNTHIVAVDSPGCGHSSYRPEGTIPNILDEIFYVLQIADALGWKEFVLMGHSRGGALTQLVAAACPERIRAIILLDLVGFYNKPAENTASRLRSGVKNFFAQHHPATLFRDLQTAAEGRMLSSPIKYESALALAKRGTSEVENGCVWSFDRRERNLSGMIRYADSQLAEILDGIETPACVVLAEQGLIANRETAEKVAAKIKNVSLHFVPGGHHVHMDDAQVVAPIINRFLSTLRS